MCTFQFFNTFQCNWKVLMESVCLTICTQYNSRINIFFLLQSTYVNDVFHSMFGNHYEVHSLFTRAHKKFSLDTGKIFEVHFHDITLFKMYHWYKSLNFTKNDYYRLGYSKHLFLIYRDMQRESVTVLSLSTNCSNSVSNFDTRF